MILYVKHIGLEGPETLGAFLARQGFSSRTIEAWDGEPFPEDLSGIEAVVSLGGPMNVYEEEQYPFLKQDHRFIQQVLQEGVPFLGICLGAQLLAKASGAKVSRAREEEIGFFSVRLTEDGVKDPLLQGVPLDLEVFQWHGDTFDIPAQSAWLIRGAGCPHQAFRVGRCAYGLQFHIEVTGKNIREWSEAYWEGDAVHRRKKDAMLSRYDQIKEKFHRAAEQIYNNFSKIIIEHKRSAGLTE